MKLTDKKSFPLGTPRIWHTLYFGLMAILLGLMVLALVREGSPSRFLSFLLLMVVAMHVALSVLSVPRPEIRQATVELLLTMSVVWGLTEWLSFPIAAYTLMAYGGVRGIVSWWTERRRT
ncbi:MAG: hypothetical protein H7Z75_05440 [Ferruginibacter sp.]|nr:hypothetical protein [Cytophagales bacterium]